MKINNKGFTLIELIVVIAIIGILGGAVFMSIRPGELLSNSRDTTRKSDMVNLSKSIDIALANAQITLQEGAKDSITGTLSVDGSGYVGFTSATPGFKLNINKLPTDPSNGNDIPNSNGKKYKYVFCSDGRDYEINVALESDLESMKNTNDNGNNDNAYEIGTKLTLCPGDVF